MARTLGESASPITGIQTLFDEWTAGVGSAAGAMGCFMVNSVAELVPYDPDVTEIAAAYSAAIQRLLAEAFGPAAVQGLGTSKQTPEQLAAEGCYNDITGRGAHCRDLLFARYSYGPHTLPRPRS